MEKWLRNLLALLAGFLFMLLFLRFVTHDSWGLAAVEAGVWAVVVSVVMGVWMWRTSQR
jgi:hypothetical protein